MLLSNYIVKLPYGICRTSSNYTALTSAHPDPDPLRSRSFPLPGPLLRGIVAALAFCIIHTAPPHYPRRPHPSLVSLPSLGSTLTPPPHTFPHPPHLSLESLHNPRSTFTPPPHTCAPSPPVARVLAQPWVHWGSILGGRHEALRPEGHRMDLIRGGGEGGEGGRHEALRPEGHRMDLIRGGGGGDERPKSNEPDRGWRGGREGGSFGGKTKGIERI